jgi:hypothetical protein
MYKPMHAPINYSSRTARVQINDASTSHKKADEEKKLKNGTKKVHLQKSNHHYFTKADKEGCKEQGAYLSAKRKAMTSDPKLVPPQKNPTRPNVGNIQTGTKASAVFKKTDNRLTYQHMFSIGDLKRKTGQYVYVKHTSKKKDGQVITSDLSANPALFSGWFRSRPFENNDLKKSALRYCVSSNVDLGLHSKGFFLYKMHSTRYASRPADRSLIEDENPIDDIELRPVDDTSQISDLLPTDDAGKTDIRISTIHAKFIQYLYTLKDESNFSDDSIDEGVQNRSNLRVR